MSKIHNHKTPEIMVDINVIGEHSPYAASIAEYNPTLHAPKMINILRR